MEEFVIIKGGRSRSFHSVRNVLVTYLVEMAMVEVLSM